MPELISYNLIEGQLRNTGAVAEITVIFNSNESVSRKIMMKEEIVVSNLPNQKIIIYNKNDILEKKLSSKINSNSILRYYGVGAQIIKDLKIKNMILVSRAKKKIIGLEGYGIKIKKQEIIK